MVSLAVASTVAISLALVALCQAAAPLSFSGWKTAMFIAAHPDDIEGCAGGTVYLLTSLQISVHYVIVTNGDKGCGASFCANFTPPQIAAVRQTEAINAAAVLQVPASNVHLLDYEDTMLTSYPEQQPRQDLVYYIRQIKPDVVFTWFPYPNFGLQPSAGWDDLGYHPDHQASGKLAMDASFDAGVGPLFPTAGPAWGVSQFYMFEFLAPTYYVALDQSTSLTAKINAYLQHKSQYPNAYDQSQQLTFWTSRVAATVANSSVSYAEGFTAFF